MKKYISFIILLLCITNRLQAQTSPLWISEVNYQSPSAGAIYLGSPSLLKLPDGSILASHDYFGSSTSSNETAVFKSTDNGNTWTLQKKLTGIFWASLFYHKNNVYLLGTSAGVTYRSIVILKSSDGGANWTTPTSTTSGILFDKIGTSNPTYHCAPTTVIVHNGRIYRGFERLVNASQSFRGYSAFVISVDENETDLLNAANWRKSTEVPYDTSSDLAGSVWNTGWIEGNVVEAPDGGLVNIMRVHSAPYVDKGAIINISNDGNTATFSSSDFIRLPGGMSKFAIRRDPVSKVYFLFTNNNTDPNYPEQRNILSMYISTNLRDWYHAKTLMEDNQGLTHEQSIAKTGFQYPDFQFDGNDIIYLVRTAYNGANNYHNSNRITFGRVENFRQYLSEKQPLAQGETGHVLITDYDGNPQLLKTVMASDSNIWLQQNVGAVRAAESSTDTQSYGDLFAWGRWNDGHQLRNNATLTNGILSPNNPSALSKTSANSFYYYATASGYFWSGGAVTDKLSANLSDVNASIGCDPCAKMLGSDWSLPTATEWQNVLTQEGISNSATAYQSNLKISLGGMRNVGNGTFGSVGTLARFWTATAQSGGQASIVNINATTANTMSVSRGGGINIRCVRLQKTLSAKPFNLKGSFRNSYVDLIWSSKGTENDTYALLKSEDGKSFSVLHQINGRQSTQFIDQNPTQGYNYYKLSQISPSGPTKDLDVIAVYAGKAADGLELVKNGNILALSIAHPSSKKAEFRLQSIDGKTILVQSINVTPATHTFQWSVNLTAGVYLVNVLFDNGEIKTKKVIF